MDILDKTNKHKYLIRIYEVLDKFGKLYLKNKYEFISEHKYIIVSILELKNKFYEKIDEENNEKNKDKNIFIASASIDSTFRLIKINSEGKI